MINVSQQKNQGSIRDNVQRNLKHLNAVSFILQLINSWKYAFYIITYIIDILFTIARDYAWLLANSWQKNLE